MLCEAEMKIVLVYPCLTEKEMATHSSICAWRIPWTEELRGLQSTGRKESGTTELINNYLLVDWGDMKKEMATHSSTLT